MTVVTKPIVAEKKDEKAILEDVTVTSPLDQTNKTSRESSTSTVILVAEHPRKRIVRCLGLLLMAIGLLGCGTILFRDMHAYRGRLRRGFCRLPIDSKVLTDGTLISGSFIDPNVPRENQNNPENMEETLVSAMKETISTKELVDENGGIEMEYEIDVETEQFEMTQMPKLSHGIYLHDFRVNKTMIMDTDNSRCFIMDLDRTEIEPPKTLLEVIEQMNNGAYNLNLNEIRREMRVVKPALENITKEKYGAIAPYCEGKMSYKLMDLEKFMETKILNKRSTDNIQNKNFQFMEFSPKGLIKYNIVNLNEI